MPPAGAGTSASATRCSAIAQLLCKELDAPGQDRRKPRSDQADEYTSFPRGAKAAPAAGQDFPSNFAVSGDSAIKKQPGTCQIFMPTPARRPGRWPLRLGHLRQRRAANDGRSRADHEGDQHPTGCVHRRIFSASVRHLDHSDPQGPALTLVPRQDWAGIYGTPAPHDARSHNDHRQFSCRHPYVDQGAVSTRAHQIRPQQVATFDELAQSTLPGRRVAGLVAAVEIADKQALATDLDRTVRSARLTGSTRRSILRQRASAPCADQNLSAPGRRR